MNVHVKTIGFAISIDTILWRMRFPDYLHLANDSFGDDAALVLREVLIHGKCSNHRIYALNPGDRSAIEEALKQLKEASWY